MRKKCTIWFDGLQVLRALLFILVYLSHSGKFFNTYPQWGRGAVYAFFVLSGFLAAIHFDREQYRKDGLIKSCFHSLVKRLKKYYPVYFFFLLIAVLTNFSSWTNFIKCLFLVQSYFFDSASALSFNWPCWFLSSMMLCFLLEPILCNLSEKYVRGGAKIFCILLILLFLSFWGMHWNLEMLETGIGYYLVYICPYIRLLDFIAGILFGQLYILLGMERFSNDLVDLAIIVGFAFQLLLCKSFPPGVQYTISWMPVTFALIWIFAKNRGVIKGFTRYNFLKHIGNISFELYITHRLILLFVSRRDTSIISWAVTTFIVFFVAEFSYRIRELSGNNGRKRKE